MSAGPIGYQSNVLGMGVRSVSGGSTYYTRDDSGTLISQRTPSGKHFFLQDALGSTVGLTDSSANVVKSVTYDPFGRMLSQTGTAPNKFYFAGGYFGYGQLYHFGERYYDPQVGRWTQQDPLDQAADLRQGNRYLYVGQDPVNRVDPSGMHFLSDELEDVQNFTGDLYNDFRGITRSGIGRCALGAAGGTRRRLRWKKLDQCRSRCGRGMRCPLFPPGPLRGITLGAVHSVPMRKYAEMP